MSQQICFIYKTTYPGVLSELNLIPTYLVKKGIHVTVVVLSNGGSDLTEVKLTTNLEILRINLDQKNNSTFQFIFKSAKIINKRNFDLVHVFHFRWVCLLPLLCRKKNIKWLMDIRSGNLKNDLRRPLANFATKLESKFYDKTAVIHRDLAQKIFGSKGNTSSKYPIFPIGVDLSLFKKKTENSKRKNLPFTLNNHVICYIGHLYRERNLHNLIEAVYFSKKIIPNIKLLIIGDGADKGRLEEIAKNFNLDKDIIFTGFIEYEKIPEFLNSSDMAISYVSTTKGYDVQPPLKTIEYLASELPVIATNTRGNRCFIKNGENGLLVKDDPHSISEAIVQIYKNRNLKEKIVKNARKSVEDYDWRNIVEEKILPVYRELLKNDENSIYP